MRRGAGLGRALICGGLLWAGLARGEVAGEPPSEAGGSWTNLAGHAMKADPVAIQGQTVTLKQAGTGRTVDVPLSVFPAGEQERLRVEKLGRGVAWLDTGTPESLLQASNFIQTLQVRQGLQVACPEEIAFERGWIDADHLRALAEPLSKNAYGQYLLDLANQPR